MISERDIIIIRGLVLQGYDNEGILNFINGEKKTEEKVILSSDKSDKKTDWKNQLGAACREIEAVRSRDELAEVNRRHSRTFGQSEVYKRVLEEACRKFPSAQRYG